MISLFENKNLNLEVRTLLNEDGSVSINLEDAARGLVIPSIRKTGSYNKISNSDKSPSGVASLLKPIIGVMHDQGSSPDKIAKQTELTLKQFGIDTIDEFVEIPKIKAKQLTIALIETEIN